jgi:hypothetical protein
MHVRNLQASARQKVEYFFTVPKTLRRTIIFESASSPSSEFWYLNDKIIKELIIFAKCETVKIPYKLH